MKRGQRAKLVAMLILIFPLLLISAASGEQVKEPAKKIVIAVYPIDTRAVDKHLSPSLTALVRAELVKSPKLAVQAEELFYELVVKQDIQATEYFEQRATQVQLGRLLKADKVVIGGLAFVNGNYLLTLETIDVAAGTLDQVASANGKETGNDLSGLAALAGKRLKNFYDPEPVTPVPLPKGHAKLPAPPSPAPAAKVEFEKKARLELKGHKYNVHTLMYSPDGKLLFSGATDASIKVWNAETGELMQTLRSHTETVLSLAVSADGRYLLSGSRDDTATLWDLATYAPLQQFSSSGDVYGVAFAPDAQRLAIAGNSHVQVFELRDGKWSELWGAYLSEVLSLAYSPDGDLVAVGGEYGTILILNADTGKQVRRINRGEGMREVRGLAFEPYSRYLVSGSDDDLVHLWTMNGIERSRMGGHRGDVNAAAVSAEGDLIFSAGNDNTVRAWSAQTGSPLAELKAGAGEFLALALRPGTRELAVAGRDSLVRVFAYKVE